MGSRALRLGFGLLFASSRALASGGDDPAARDAYVADQRGLMTVLAGWSAGSVVTGSAMWAAGAPLTRYAGMQNVAWGLIDGAIAGYALWKLGDDARAPGDAEHWRDERAKLRRVFWINVALDVLYVGAGGALAAFGKTDALRGTGAGVIAQGGFLLLFDATGALVVGP